MRCISFRNRSFWSICLTYGLSIGVLNAFDGVLDLNLKDHDVSQVCIYFIKVVLIF